MRPPPPLLFLGLLALAACGGGPKRPPQAPASQELTLPEGEGAWTLRLNRLPCQPGSPELQFELQTPLGWERVLVEDPEPEDEDDVMATLERAFDGDARAVVTVRGVIRSEVRPYGTQHRARVVWIVSVGS